MGARSHSAPWPQCTLATGPAPTRRPANGLLMPAGHPGAPGRGLCHAEAGVPVCRLLTGPVTLRCRHWRQEWHHMPGKGQPGVESGSQTQVTAQSFPSKCPSTVPPARLGGHPPPCRESDHLVRNGFLSPQLTPLPAFQPFSRCFSLLPPSPYLCLSVCLSPPSPCSPAGTTPLPIPQHRLACTPAGPAPLRGPRCCSGLDSWSPVLPSSGLSGALPAWRALPRSHCAQTLSCNPRGRPSPPRLAHPALQAEGRGSRSQEGGQHVSWRRVSGGLRADRWLTTLNAASFSTLKSI